MLAQLVALLALGVLCSSAPTPQGHPHQQQCNTTFVENIIKEVQSDVEEGRVIVPTMVPKNVTKKNCMRSNLEAFLKVLKTNETVNNKTIGQLSELYKCENLFPEVSDEECKTMKESSGQKTLEKFLRFLYQEL